MNELLHRELRLLNEEMVQNVTNAGKTGDRSISDMALDHLYTDLKFSVFVGGIRAVVAIQAWRYYFFRMNNYTFEGRLAMLAAMVWIEAKADISWAAAGLGELGLRAMKMHDDVCDMIIQPRPIAESVLININHTLKGLGQVDGVTNGPKSWQVVRPLVTDQPMDSRLAVIEDYETTFGVYVAKDLGKLYIRELNQADWKV